MKFPEKMILVETDGEMSKYWLEDGNFARYRGVKSRYLSLPNWTIYFYRKKRLCWRYSGFYYAWL